MLLRQFGGDPSLSRYDCIVVDEVHERHAGGDFLLGILKRVVQQRPALKLVLMSATINADLFSSYFDNAPLIQVPGKLFPVEVEYVPTGEEDKQLTDERLHRERQALAYRQSIAAQLQYPDPKPYLKILEKIDKEYPVTQRGDVLVFLSGLNEISLIADELTQYAKQTRRWIVLKMHSTLSIAEQDKVFGVAPEGVRKCILSTNIAETSITIDGIRFIVDSGKVKELDYDLTANLSKLTEFWISKSSAKQRMGRAGRTGPGHCFRLYSQGEHDHFNDFPVPEILRGPLTSIVLQMKALDLGDPAKFDFIERPPPAHLQHAIRHLRALGALTLDSSHSITQLGYALSHLPVDAILGKMLILATAFDLIEPILTMAAGLSIQTSPFLRIPPEESSATHQRRAAMMSSHGDPFSLWNAYNAWLQVKRDKQESSRRWCRRLGIEEQRMYEISKLMEQFRSILQNNLNHREEVEEEGGPGKRKRRRNMEAFAKLQRFKSSQMDASNRGKKLQGPEEVEAAAELSDPEDDGDQVDALEFDYRHDLSLEQTAPCDPASLSHNQLTMLKLILCSGLYPNLAFPDTANMSRRISDQMYHTRFKRFVLVHPTSVFANASISTTTTIESVSSMTTRNAQGYVTAANDGDVDLTNMQDITDAPFGARRPGPLIGSTSDPQRAIVSSVPEFLCYLNMMETHKPYLMNLFRVPALHASLLFGRQIDTNEDGTCLVVDDWILVDFKRSYATVMADHSEDDEEAKRIVSETAMGVVSKVVLLRRLWARLVNTRLMGSRNVKKGLRDSSATLNEVSKEILDTLPLAVRTLYERERRQEKFGMVLDAIAEQEIREIFVRELEPFLSIDSALLNAGVRYDIDTLRDSDLSALFPGCTFAHTEEEQDDSMDHRKSRMKNGIQLTPFLRYGSVQYQTGSAEEEQDVKIGAQRTRRNVWECPQCHKAWMVTEAEKAKHLKEECKPASTTDQTSGEKKNVPGKKGYVCDRCNQTLDLTPMEILRHKKSCA